MFTTYTQGLIASGEAEVVARPSAIGVARYAIYVHGAGDLGASWLNVPLRFPIFRALIDQGYTVVSPDLGGPQTWGNSVQQSRIDSTYSFIKQQTGGNPKVLLVGQSMGGLGSFIWAANNPAKVDRLAALIPVVNLADVHDRPDYFRELIDTAYGGSYNDAVQGLDRNPLRLAASGRLHGVKMKVWYGAGDELCKPTDARQFGALTGAPVVAVPGGHAEMTVGRCSEFGFEEFIS